MMLGHLQVYRAWYRFQNSTILIEDLCKKASDLHYEALALTAIGLICLGQWNLQNVVLNLELSQYMV